MAKIHYTEIFYSAQGEGRFVGVPSVFLRTFGCNFRCKKFGRDRNEIIEGNNPEVDNVIKLVKSNPEKYKTFNDLPLTNTGCDTYASIYTEFKNYAIKDETDDLARKMLDLVPSKSWIMPNGNDTHLVITGGEPLLGWQRAYPELLSYPNMLNLQNLTFETNGTQELSADFRHFLLNWTLNSKLNSKGTPRGVNALTFSVSAKLSASGEKWEDAIKPEIVRSYEEVGTTYLKFVVEKPEDFDEVDQAVAEYRRVGFKGVVYIMPVGGVVKVYDNNKFNVADEAMRRGYYYSPRLHVDLWGNSWGK